MVLMKSAAGKKAQLCVLVAWVTTEQGQNQPTAASVLWGPVPVPDLSPWLHSLCSTDCPSDRS